LAASTPEALRRVFPAHDWKLVVSRQLLISEDPFDPWSRDAVASIPTTAVAVRFQKGVRVTGQDHLMELATPQAGSPDRTKPPAGTAVRLNVQGRSLWVVSVALSAGCTANVASCPALGLLDRWRQTHRAEGDQTIVGGRLESGVSASPCSEQEIVSDPPAATIPALQSTSEQHSLAGCLARLDVAR
jgi:hypothetical protein